MATVPATGLVTLPTEILIETISCVPWSRTQFGSLRLVCRRFSDILSCNENLVARELIKTQFPPHSLLVFPGLTGSKDSRLGYSTVHRVQSRLGVLGRIEKSCYGIRERDGKQAIWMIPRWIRLQAIGLCLLFRLHDAGCNENQIILIRSLPPTSLAMLLFTLMMSIQQLRADGPDILNVQSPVQNATFRGEIELACEELILQHGADYLASLWLDQEPRAIRMLENEYDMMETRQMPCAEGKSKHPTLISVLRRAFSASLGCDWRDNHKHMWELLEGGRLEDISEDDATRIIHGETLHR